MGRGRGGYTQKQIWYLDSGGNKVTDRGAIFVAELYMDMGYESVFRREHTPDNNYHLTIKSSDDLSFIKNIEVKQTTSPRSSKMASNICKGFVQLHDDYNATVAIYLPNLKNYSTGREYAKKGFEEALRKGWVRGKVEVWFSDKTRIFMN